MESDKNNHVGRFQSEGVMGDSTHFTVSTLCRNLNLMCRDSVPSLDTLLVVEITQLA